MADPRPIRVTFVEPSLAAYRVPFFRKLARRPELDVTLLYAQSGRVNAAPDGFNAHLVGRRTVRVAGQPIYWQPSQISAVDPDRADVVSFDWDVHYALLVPALLRAKARGVASILWGHGTSGNDGTWKAWPRQELARLADVLVTYAEDARRQYIARGWDADRVWCAPNAIDQAPVQDAYDAVRAGFTREEDATDAARRHLRLRDGPVLLFVSRLDAVRRLDVLIDAAAIVARSHPAVQLAIVGDGAERGPIERRAADAGIAHVVRFAGAEYDEVRLARWYAAADVVVHPAWLGLSVYHAMGHGRPVVTADDAHLHPPEAASIVHGHTGLRFPANDAAACAAAVGRLLDDTALRLRLGRTARERAVREHSIDRMVDRFAGAIAAARARVR